MFIMKKFFTILLCMVLLAPPLALSASATDGDFAPGEKPWFIMPWWLKIQYAVKSWMQMGFKEDSMLILHEGRLVYEQYADGHGENVPHMAMSVTKSVVAALVGIAVEEGLIGSVQDKVHEYYPGASIAGQDSKKDMTIEHLLTMRSGLPDSQGCFRAADAGLAAFETPQAKKPGRLFSFTYNSGAGPQCLIGIVENVTGMKLNDYADLMLFGPLGITNYTWETTDSGSPIGGFGLHMTARDMLRFGQLYLNDGVWNGQRILPEGWAAGTQPAFNTIVSYGLLFWGNGWGPLISGSYEARGFHGQFITVYPEKGVVVVRTGS
jgi:CubicO group peptidase (beta-lactamase class C family)